MHYVVMEWVHGVNTKNLDRTMKLFSDHSWIQPPMHIGIEGYEGKYLNNFTFLIFTNAEVAFDTILSVELAWRSGCMMDCHATARGSIPGGNGVLTELHVLLNGQ